MGAEHFTFDPVKDSRLKKERGIGFERIIALIESGKLLRVLRHPNEVQYPGQFLYEVDVEGYVFVVPVVKRGSELFLKTIYPSRKATKTHRSGAKK